MDGAKSLLCCSIAMSIACRISYAGTSAGPGNDEAEFQQDLSRIASSAETRDINLFVHLGNELHVKWFARNEQRHAELMLRLCAPISSGRFGISNIPIVRKFALDGLVDTDAIDVLTEARLAENVGSFLISTGTAWTSLRREDVSVRLHAWKRLERDSVWPSNLDPNDPPQVSIGMGIEPDRIKDPEASKKYDAAWEKNDKKAAKWGRAISLQRGMSEFSLGAEKYIIAAYSKSPFDSKELQGLMKKYGMNGDASQRMMDAVSKNIADYELKKFQGPTKVISTGPPEHPVSGGIKHATKISEPPNQPQ